MVVMLHGGQNPISIIDGWGIPQEAARREWIVIAPSVELDDVLDEILARYPTTLKLAFLSVAVAVLIGKAESMRQVFLMAGLWRTFLATKDRMYMRPWHRAARRFPMGS